MTPEELARLILDLTGPELVRLNEILRSEGGEAVGVREPRNPIPPQDSAEEHALPPDYWETAQ